MRLRLAPCLAAAHRFSLAFLLAIFGVTITPSATAQSAPNKPGTLTAEQAAQDVRTLRRALLDLHPGRTKYQSEEGWKANLAQFEARGGAARSATEMYLAVTEFTASLRCGHTWPNNFNQKGLIRAALLDAADKLPFMLTLVDGRWLVLASADAAITTGDEILSINGAAVKRGRGL
jgi:hypothetical protein